MKSREEVWKNIKLHIKKEWKIAFVVAFVIGLLIHMPIMLSDIPNHDGLASMHFDQNMITSGRWFLSVACGFSSYYTLPWLIGLLAMLYLGLAAVVLTETLEVKSTWAIAGISGMLVAFPALASTFAYVFTMDGYMLAVLLATLSVWFTKRFKWGFVAGGVCLALSMGIYQAYLAFAMLLCIYAILMLVMEQGSIKEKVQSSLKYLYMGICGAGIYYVVLQVLLKVQGKELGSYQGAETVGTGNQAGLLETIKNMYVDFFGFTLKGNVLANNVFSYVAIGLLAVAVLVVLVLMAGKKKWFAKPWIYLLVVLLVIGLPVATNIILLILPEVTYHTLMRYQWVLFPILMIAFVDKYGKEVSPNKFTISVEWAVLLSVIVLIWNYTVTDNIAYSNMQKKYEKTYAYCLRLLDRMEQTEGYYQGIPIAMIGVVGDEAYPITDITEKVTAGLIGTDGDYLLYTGQNYKQFMEHYLGASLNILPPAAMAQMYYSEEYVNMKPFPDKDSIKIIDGVMYIKTENVDKNLIAQP